MTNDPGRRMTNMTKDTGITNMTNYPGMTNNPSMMNMLSSHPGSRTYVTWQSAPSHQCRDASVTQFSSFDSVMPADVSKLIHDVPNKQSWLDPLPMWLLKECSDLLSPFLTALCNTSLRNGTVPALFKTAVVTPLIKKSSMDVNKLQNYRPISNLSFISKFQNQCSWKAGQRYPA